MANNYKKAIAEAKEDLRGIIDVIKEVEKDFAVSAGNMSANMSKVFKGGNTPNEFSGQLKKQQQEIDNLNEKLKQLSTETAKASEKKKEITELTAKEKVETQALNAQKKLEAKATTKVAGAYQQLIAKHRLAKKALQDSIVQYGKLHKKTKQAQKDFDKLTKKVNLANKATSNFSKTGLGRMARGFKNLIGAFGIIGGVTLLAEFSNSVFKTLKELDKLNFSLEAVIKNEGELAQTRAFLTSLTLQYGAEIVSTTERYTKFMVAARQSGVELKKTEDIFRTVTKASAVLGLKTDELTGVYLALEQMLSKGKVTTEELRRQLGERLPGAFGIMADALGVSTIELDKMLRKGEILSAEALPKFAVALEEALGIEAVEKVETLQTATGRLSSAWVSFVESMNSATGVGGALRQFIDFLAKSVGNLAREFRGVEGSVRQSTFAEEFKIMSETSTKSIDALKTDLKSVRSLIEEESQKLEGMSLFNSSIGDIREQKRFLGVFRGRADAIREYIKLLEQKNRQEKIDRDELINKIVLKNKDISLAKLEAMSLKELRDLWVKLNDAKSNKNAEKLARQSLKDAQDLEVSRLKIAIEAQEKIIENENLSLNERITANENYKQLIEDLLVSQTKFAVKQAGNRKDLVTKIEEEANAKRIENAERTEENVLKIKNDAFKKIQEQLKQTVPTDNNLRDTELADLDRKLSEILNKEGLNAEERKKIIEKYNEDVAKIEEDYAIQTLENQIGLIDNLLQHFKGSEEQKAILKQQLFDLSVSLAKTEADIAIAESDRADQKEEELHRKKMERLSHMKDLFRTVFNTFGEMYDLDLGKFDFLFDEKKNTVGEWADLAVEIVGTVLNASLQRYDIELQEAQRVRDLTLENELSTEEEKEAARRQFEEKERRIKTKRAKQERTNTLIQIAVDTASAVVKSVAASPLTFGLPFSAIALGIGAAQAAFVASQPLPKFAKGTENAPEGWAVVDEEGAEIHTDKNMNVKSMGSDKGANLRFLEKGDKIFPAGTNPLKDHNPKDIEKAVWQLNLQSNGVAINEYEVDKALYNEMKGMRSDMDKMGRRMEKMASRPIKNTVKVELEDNRAY